GAAHLPLGGARLPRQLAFQAPRPGARQPGDPAAQPGPRGGAVPHRHLPAQAVQRLAHRGVADGDHPVRRGALDLLGQPLHPRSGRPRRPDRLSRPRSPKPGAKLPRRPERSWAFQLVRNVLLWALPMAAVWALLTPVYNRFLLGSAENLVQMGESPDVTDLVRHPDN